MDNTPKFELFTHALSRELYVRNPNVEELVPVQYDILTTTGQIIEKCSFARYLFQHLMGGKIYVYMNDEVLGVRKTKVIDYSTII